MGMGAQRTPQSWSATTPTRPVNFIVAHFAVTPDVLATDLCWLLDKTPAHVVLLVLDAVASDGKGVELIKMAKDAVYRANRRAYAKHLGMATAPTDMVWMGHEVPNIAWPILIPRFIIAPPWRN